MTADLLALIRVFA